MVRSRHKGWRRLGVFVACACCVALWLAGLTLLAFGSTLIGVGLIVLGGGGLGVVFLASSRDKNGSFWELIIGVLEELFGRA